LEARPLRSAIDQYARSSRQQFEVGSRRQPSPAFSLVLEALRYRT
jgi:hypothetical protein